MAHPTLADARELSQWQPQFGVISVYMGFDPGDRGRGWFSRLRSGADQLLREGGDGEREQRLALRETAARLLGRFEGEEGGPPPRGLVGFLEVSRGEGQEHWWETGTAPDPTVLLGKQRR